MELYPHIVVRCRREPNPEVESELTQEEDTYSSGQDDTQLPNRIKQVFMKKVLHMPVKSYIMF